MKLNKLVKEAGSVLVSALELMFKGKWCSVLIYLLIFLSVCSVATMIYRVAVHQERLFLSGDAHRTVIQLVGSRGASERVRLAERSVSLLNYKFNLYL